ncbi:hypothetical protein SAY87_009378 [Trapa incisa]|uniref:C2H2-type domain-containing protein n=1 Tax=Trapa incisa TaxID=236973 RepID=A0AAN7JXM6_9MYRT|nr:hypothetical protein SAY87_009378 [Trapa incisa]
METRKRKVCSKKLSNGRALGRHMRSHSQSIPACEESNPKPVYKTDSVSWASPSSSSSSSEEEEEEVQDQMSYGLRENPKKSIRLSDPSFSLIGSVVLQDSEIESSKNLTEKRSRRLLRSSSSPVPTLDTKRKIDLRNFSSSRTEDSFHKIELEQGSSSISDADATVEEDMAIGLMMLSRDRRGWQKKHSKSEEEEEYGRSREIYRCETCMMSFRSYQALGGHRASHRKFQMPQLAAAQVPVSITAKGRDYKCPYCSRVFSSGQALGGHKRTHTAGGRVPFPKKNSGDAHLDLNLPAPADDEDDLFVQSAVSAAQYIHLPPRWFKPKE